MDELLPCPFCDAAPYTPSQLKKSKRVTGCTNKRCAIFGIWIDTRDWNRRAPVADVERMKTQLSASRKAVAYWQRRAITSTPSTSRRGNDAR